MTRVSCRQRRSDRSRRLVALVGMICVLAGACSSNAAPAPDGSGDAGTDLGAPTSGDADADRPGTASAANLGGFEIRLVAPSAGTAGTSARPGTTLVQGRVLDGPQPALLQWNTTAQAGDCQLREPHVPFCSPGCGNAVCVSDGTCAGRPTGQSVGTVTIKGLRAEAGPLDVVMPAEPPGYTYAPPTDVKLAFPPFDGGADVEVVASGGDTGTITLRARAISLLDLPETGAIVADRNQVLALRWKASPHPEAARITIAVDLSHHGGIKGMIICDTADSGALEIPAALVTQLIGLGVAGFPALSIARTSAATAVIAGGTIAGGVVALTIVSAVERPVVVPGVTSCNDDIPCPSPKTCQANLTCK